MNITHRAEWDGTFSLLIDGEVVVERKSLDQIEQLAKYAELLVILKGLDNAKTPV